MSADAQFVEMLEYPNQLFGLILDCKVPIISVFCLIYVGTIVEVCVCSLVRLCKLHVKFNILMPLTSGSLC